jgi:hypothetical protein
VGSITGTLPVDIVPTFTEVKVPEAQRLKLRAALPAVFLDFPWPEVSGRSIRVDTGGNLQSALNNARCGDEIVLAAGATFTGNLHASGEERERRGRMDHHSRRQVGPTSTVRHAGHD